MRSLPFASAALLWTLDACSGGAARAPDTPARASSDGAPPPVARVVPHVTELHGVKRIDNYHWLRERNNPEVRAYLEAENAYTTAVMRHTESLQEQLYEEMKARIKESDTTAPVRMGDYLYYRRTEAGGQYPVYCRKKGDLNAREEVLLDLNALGKGKQFLRIGSLQVSPDHRLLAYTVDTTGAERYTLRVKDLESGELLPDEIANTWGAIQWMNDNRTLVYTTVDAAMRPHEIYRHRLGSRGPDELLHREEDARFYIDLSKTKSGKYILALLESQISAEVRALDADQPSGSLRLIRARQQNVEYKVDHHTDSFYILTNEGAVNFKLMKAPVEDLSPERWQEVIAHSDDVMLHDIELFRRHMAVYRRVNGVREIQIWNLATGERHDVEFDEPVHTVYGDEYPEIESIAFGGSNPVFDSSVLRFRYTSLTTPTSVFDYDMDSRERVLRKAEEVLGGYDPSRYRTERLTAVAADGVKIPISLVYEKGLQRNRANPCLLVGYGAYGASYDPEFSSKRVSLLDRGVIYAIAHVRGGGDLGRRWYLAGKLLSKKNTFTDFIAAAEHLIERGYTSRERLAIEGMSAGGLLIGAVVNMRPKLFAAAVARVPFVDVINTMLDASIPLTVIEFEEWGNPRDEKYYRYMRSYSPYDNVERKAYPHLLITAGLNDSRVQYWEPAKWTAKLRAFKTDRNRLLLKVDMGSGHAGASGRYDRLRERAFELAFVLDALGVVAR